MDHIDEISSSYTKCDFFSALLYQNTGRVVAVSTVSASASVKVVVFLNLLNLWMEVVHTYPYVRY